MGHNVVLIGGLWLVAAIAVWLLCRWRGYTVAAWVAPLTTALFALVFLSVLNTRAKVGSGCHSCQAIITDIWSTMQDGSGRVSAKSRRSWLNDSSFWRTFRASYHPLTALNQDCGQIPILRIAVAARFRVS